MAIANTAASLRPAALAASIIVVAATMPPVRGGSPRDNKAAVHEQGADEQCQDAHTRKSRKADHNGLPLLQQLLDADHGAHVRNQQIDTD